MAGPFSLNLALVTYKPETCTIQVTPPTRAHPMTMALPPTTAQTAPQGRVAIPRQGTNGEPTYRSPERPHRSYNSACEVCRDRKAKCPGEKPECSFCITNGYECVYPTSKREKDRMWTEHLEQENKRLRLAVEKVASLSDMPFEDFMKAMLRGVYTPPNPQPEPAKASKPSKSGKKRKRSETDESADSSGDETVTGNTMGAEQAAPVAPVGPVGPVGPAGPAGPPAPHPVSAPVVVPQPDSTSTAPPLAATPDQSLTMGDPAFASGLGSGSGSGFVPGPTSHPAIDSDSARMPYELSGHGLLDLPEVEWKNWLNDSWLNEVPQRPQNMQASGVA
ncbi:hypothetical protein BDV19DRAFT_389683 [Aspergillus venezuelensis]